MKRVLSIGRVSRINCTSIEKGESKMKLGRILLGLGLLASICLAVPCFQSLAGNPPPANPTIVGPEYWGVIVFNCSNNTGTLRVKRVVDCDVETQGVSMVFTSAVCDGVTESSLMYQWFDASIFGETGKPIITKVKNFKDDPISSPNVKSADVEIQFCTNCE
jgi:hypothetical protein